MTDTPQRFPSRRKSVLKPSTSDLPPEGTWQQQPPPPSYPPSSAEDTSGFPGTPMVSPIPAGASPSGAAPTPRTFGQKLRYAILTIIGGIGELLITAGFLVGMFAVWQLYWTTFEVEATRDAQVSAFHNTIGSAPNNVSTDLRYDIPPSIDNVKVGDVFATIYVPRWDMMAIPVAEGTNQYILDQAFAGHYFMGEKPTAYPGQVGNFSVAAHRRSYGNSFRYIDTIEAGDPVVVETKDAFIVYKATDSELVLPDRWQVIAPVPNQPEAQPTEQLMTMTTCATSTGGQFGNSHRYIQHFKFDHWVPRASGIPVELVPGGNK